MEMFLKQSKLTRNVGFRKAGSQTKRKRVDTSHVNGSWLLN